MKVEFLPEPGAVAAVAKQIKATHRAFPLFGTGRLFLERPERHRVRLTTLNPEAPLYQVADGPIALDRALVDRDAFRVLKSKYYREETLQGDPPKGNFSNVARLRSSGLLIGPTNYHSYQPALRRIYEERYSRRMSFAEFQQREIVVVNDEQSINDWKEQARTTVTWSTTQEAEPKTFKSLAEVEAHFRQHYLAAEIKCAPTLEANGAAMRTSGDRSLIASIRETIEKERAFPAGIVNAMRPALTESGLHFFKHRKRVVYVSTIRPLPHPVGQPAKESVAKILALVAASPRCTRHDLAVKLIGKDFEAPEKTEEKTALAADLHYLLLAGHVIEFTDGKFDLPLQPKMASEPAGAAGTETESAETAAANVDAPVGDTSGGPPEAAQGKTPAAEPTEPDMQSGKADVSQLPLPKEAAAELGASALPERSSEAPEGSLAVRPFPVEQKPAGAALAETKQEPGGIELSGPPDVSSAELEPHSAITPDIEEPVPELVATSGETIAPPAELPARDTQPAKENVAD